MNITGILVLLLAVFTSLPVLAYVGPGMGLTAITSLLALFAAIFITLFSFIWLPLKRLFKGKKNNTPENIDNEKKEGSESD